MDLIDLIQEENENTGLDFKAAVYTKEKFDDLLVDIMAMANANLNRDRYIVVGVKHQPDGDRIILGIQDIIDDATYYQLVHTSIEPDIHFEYSYVVIDDKRVGVFRIFDCDDPPYMMKKDSAKLKKGDGYIRKGTSQMRIMRSDIDRIFAKRQASYNFYDKIEAVLEEDGKPCNSLRPWESLILPSDRKAAKIRRVIAKKEQEEIDRQKRLQAAKDGPFDIHTSFFNNMPRMPTGLGLFGGSSYEDRDIPTLKGNLEIIKQTYEDHDLYYLYEQKAHKINISITNNGDRYIENCSVEIKLKRSFNFIISARIYDEPEESGYFGPPIPRGPSLERLNYPHVEETDSYYIITAHPGDLKHSLSTPVLKVPARLLLPTNSTGSKLEITLSVFGKNLPKPFVKDMVIDIAEVQPAAAEEDE